MPTAASFRPGVLRCIEWTRPSPKPHASRRMTMRLEKALRATALVVVVGLSIGLSSIAGAQGASHGHSWTFISFDVPGSPATFPKAINPAGQIVGSYRDASDVEQGFVRERDGTITSFDPPGSRLTRPAAINPAGRIVGFYLDASDVQHGFVRDRDGTITVLDLGSVSTSAEDINPAG